MGRIRTRLIKRMSNEILATHESQFSEDFEHNKVKVGELSEVSTKKLRNKVAGYITKLVKTKSDI